MLDRRKLAVIGKSERRNGLDGDSCLIIGVPMYGTHVYEIAVFRELALVRVFQLKARVLQRWAD